MAMTSRPLYFPQAGHARWDMIRSPQLGQTVITGAVSFQCEERLLSRLALDVFLFGTAIFLHLQIKLNIRSFVILNAYLIVFYIQKLLKYSQSWINFSGTGTGPVV